MFASEILPFLSEIVGTCDDPRAFAILEDGIKLMNDKGLIDPLIGEMTICNCRGFVTLPPEVTQILAVTVDKCPAVIRNEWFRYHINGPGDQCHGCGFVDVLGTYPIFQEPDRPVLLVAKIYNALDADSEVRIYGYAKNGDRIYSTDAAGNKKDGFLVPTIWEGGESILAPNADVPPIVQIDKVKLQTRADYVDLIAVDPETNEPLAVLGRYRPDETAPQYKRIQVECESVINLKFKRRDFKITGPDSWINTDNRLALIQAVRAAKKYWADASDEAQTAEAVATRLLKEENRSNKPGGISPPQVIVDGVDGSPSNLFYGRCRHY